MPGKHSTRVTTGIRQYFHTKRAAFVSRVAVLLLIPYLFAMVNVGRYISGDIWNGLFWTSSGYAMFPIPFDLTSLGYGTTPTHYDLNFFDIFIYVIFIGQWFWIFWMSLG